VDRMGIFFLNTLFLAVPVICFPVSGKYPILLLPDSRYPVSDNR
jgi:hypothetical protein